MHACGDPGVPCDALQHADEPGPVGLIERGKQFGIVLVGRPLGSRQERAGLPGEVNGVGTPVTWVTSTLHQTSILMVTGVLAAIGNICLLRATRFAPANQLAPMHYSQIVWAVIIGALIFNENPDTISVLGLAIIAGSGLLTVAREKIRLGTVRWNPFGRNRL